MGCEKNNVSLSFHRNMLLLTQMIPPNEDFKKHFKADMFDKPNTAGFLCVSHYLLTIYDSNHFESSVVWPVVCKKTEAKYRNDVKGFLTTIAKENPDIGFPPILTSYLFHATGTKFVIVMWKLSEVTIRRYLNRNSDYNVLLAPKSGLTENLSKNFLRQRISDMKNHIQEMHKDAAEAEETVNNFAMEESTELNAIKTELFERKESLQKAASESPGETDIKKHLSDVENTEIIQMWKSSIQEHFKFIRKRYGIFQDIKEPSTKIINIVTNKTAASKKLNAAQIAKINSSIELPISPEEQYLLYDLYLADERLVLNNFLILFNLLLGKLYWRLKKNSLEDMSLCLAQLEGSSQDVKTASDIFKDLLITSTNSATELRNNLNQREIFHNHGENTITAINNVLLLESPLIKIKTNCSDETNNMQKQFELTPVEGCYKSLFSRYKRNNTDDVPQISNLPVMRINFDDTLSFNNSEVHPPSVRSTASKINWRSTKKSGKYSRLFSSVKKSHMRANLSVMSIPCTSKANSTAVTNAIFDLSLDLTAKSLFNASKETASPKEIERKETECIFDDVEDETNKTNKLEIYVSTETEVASNDSKSAPVKTTGNSRRQSISDLVERYNKLLSNRTVNLNDVDVFEDKK